MCSCAPRCLGGVGSASGAGEPGMVSEHSSREILPSSSRASRASRDSRTSRGPPATTTLAPGDNIILDTFVLHFRQKCIYCRSYFSVVVCKK